MGAWIEIHTHFVMWFTRLVAPFMGAWIEIDNTLKSIANEIRSHPLWVRGLKYNNHIPNRVFSLVAPFMGAWIEINKKIFKKV